MFGCFRIKTVFRTAVRRDIAVRLIDNTCHAFNNVVVSGRFVYLFHDNAVQVAVTLPCLGSYRLNLGAGLCEKRVRMLDTT